MSDNPYIASVEMMQRFLGALFVPGDHLVFRSIETWTENGQKRSQLKRSGIRYHELGVQDLSLALSYLMLFSERDQTNLFFGVCPRVGDLYYDQAWQIRTVRALW